MSRWKSPQTAAKHATREARKAEELLKEKRKSRLILVGIVLLMIGSVVADLFFIAYTQHQRHHRHQPQFTNQMSSHPLERKP